MVDVKEKRLSQKVGQVGHNHWRGLDRLEHSAPSSLIKIPAVQKFIAAAEDKLLFDIQKIRYMCTEIICFSLLITTTLVLNTGLTSQSLPLFCLVLTLTIKLLLNTNKRMVQQRVRKIPGTNDVLRQISNFISFTN